MKRRNVIIAAIVLVALIIAISVALTGCEIRDSTINVNPVINTTDDKKDDTHPPGEIEER